MKEEYKPDLALPFVIDRKEAIEIIRKNFAKKMFIPKDFCSTSSLESLQEDMFHFGCMIWRPMCILKEKEEKSERGQKETMIVRRRAYIVL